MVGDQTSRAVGYLYMLVSTTSFTLMAAVSKIIGARASTEEKLFWRSLLSILFTAASAASSRHACTHKMQWPQCPWLLLLRGFCGHIALLAYLEAIELMPLAEAVFLGKVHPTSASLLSWAFLGERLSAIRGLSIAVSIFGVGLIAKPSWEGLVSGTLLGPTLALLAGCLSGAAYCCVRSLGRSHEAEMWTLLALPMVSLPFCLKHAWSGLQEGHETAVWVWLLALGICTQFGQVFLARGLALLPAASGTQAMHFGTLSGVVAAALLGEGLPGLQAAVGGVLILGSLQVAEILESRGVAMAKSRTQAQKVE